MNFPCTPALPDTKGGAEDSRPAVVLKASSPNHLACSSAISVTRRDTQCGWDSFGCAWVTCSTCGH